jgi:AraC-like DNA-binding protein
VQQALALLRRDPSLTETQIARRVGLTQPRLSEGLQPLGGYDWVRHGHEVERMVALRRSGWAVEAIARELGWSPRRVHDTFQRHAGIPPTDF